ncbi:hypothetical protein L5515_012301 [Caenorhabditis briggsae]|uniref:Uncharacterized protein n=1 Tax=Caenorhabditis briggsae TaxID=6238 RepID=A0AAE9JFS8_CAEBR|nr:hypothetical protein L5515_012301 [Caenorhabditis briggsae]
MHRLSDDSDDSETKDTETTPEDCPSPPRKKSKRNSVKTMKDIIENCVTSSNLTDFRLPVFSEPSVKFAKFRNEDHKLCDGLSWWKTTNGRKIRPRPRKIEYDGCSYRYYNCINPNDDAFKKFEIYPEKEEYMVAGSRRKMMPTCFSLIHVDNDSPRISVFFHTLTSIIFAFLGDTDQLVDYLTVTGMLTTIFALAVLVIIKWKRMPIAADPVQYSIFWPILNLVIMIALLVIPIEQDAISSIIGFGMFLAGIVVYFIVKFIVTHSKFLLLIDKKLTHLCQILTWTIVDSGPEEKTRL